MVSHNQHKNWGNRPWTIDFVPTRHELQTELDFAVVGGGFTGLSAAARLKRLAPEKTVALFEADELGAGSSGHTGGIALAESAVGDLPGLGDVLKGYKKILQDLDIDADLFLPGAYEIGRSSPTMNSPICWSDSGQLAIQKSVAGGTINPGKVVSGLARAAERARVLLFEKRAVSEAKFAEQVELVLGGHGSVYAKKVLFATNAYAFELTGLLGRAESSFTLAVATEELTEQAIQEIGLSERKPFYTVDLPYLWGRLLGNAIIFGSGLLYQNDWRDLAMVDISQTEPAEMFARQEKRIRGLHPRLANVSFTHRWGGPICIGEEWIPVFEHHRESQNAVVLGAFSGHGVAQSVYLGSWAAEALLGDRELPNWRK